MPVPEPNPATGLNGTILASVTVPAEASTSDDVSQSLIHDRRRQALKRPYEGWLSPALNTDFHAYEPEEFRNWPFAVWGGWTFWLWSYTFMQPANGVVEIGPGFDLHLQLIDYESTDAGSLPAGDTGLVWTREPQQTDSPQRGEPITTIDVDGAIIEKCRCTHDSQGEAFTQSTSGDGWSVPETSDGYTENVTIRDNQYGAPETPYEAGYGAPLNIRGETPQQTADLRVYARDSDGNPITGATITVEQQSDSGGGI